MRAIVTHPGPTTGGGGGGGGEVRAIVTHPRSHVPPGVPSSTVIY